MPFLYLRVAMKGEGLSWYFYWERLARIRMFDTKIVKGGLYERHVLFRTEEYLYGFPPNKAGNGQRRNRRR